jgi:hypothetical protein
LSALGGYPALIVLGGAFLFLRTVGRRLCGYPETEAEKIALRLRGKRPLTALW